MKISFGRTEVVVQQKPERMEFKPVPPRKPRCDKRIRSTLRIASRYDEIVKAIAYNHSTSKQKVLDRIIKMVLDSDELRSKLIASFPKDSQKHPYLVMRE